MLRAAAAAGYVAAAAAAGDTARLSRVAAAVNADARSTWTAAAPTTTGLRYAALPGLRGDPAGNAAGLPTRRVSDLPLAARAAAVPAAFDARAAWPQCPLIAEIRDQSACGSCYAVAAAAAATDRLCVAKNGTGADRLSAADLMDCCKSCGNANGGCSGGDLSKTWAYITSQGIASGGGYLDSSGCLAYPFPPCDHHVAGTHGACAPQPYFAPPCFWACDANSTSKVGFDADQASHKFASSYVIDASVEAIQRDILAHGPASAFMYLVESFEVYSSGVYTTKDKDYIGAHAVKIMGWGTASTQAATPYWLIANSWNKEWGEAGTFRIERGANVLGIEQGVTAGVFTA